MPSICLSRHAASVGSPGGVDKAAFECERAIGISSTTASAEGADLRCINNEASAPRDDPFLEDWKNAVSEARTCLEHRRLGVLTALENVLLAWGALPPPLQFPLSGASRKSEAISIVEELLVTATDVQRGLFREAIGGSASAGTGDVAAALLFEEEFDALKGQAWVKEALVGLGIVREDGLVALKRRVSFKEGEPEQLTIHASGSCGRASDSSSIRSALNSPPEADLWNAVQKGDTVQLGRLLVALGGSPFPTAVVDGKGHSVLWYLVAWGHIGVALAVLRGCPFGAPGASSIAETHHSRGDTLLHLLCRSSVTVGSTELSQVFCLIATAMLSEDERAACQGTEHTPLLTKQNAAGETFMDIAVAGLKFWAVRCALQSMPADLARLLLLGPKQTLRGASEPPLQSLVSGLPKPELPRADPVLQSHPAHLDFSHMLVPDPSLDGAVPYADVAFEICVVAAATSSPSNISPSEKRILLAHRVIVASRSPVLMQALMRLTPEPIVIPGRTSATLLPVMRIDPRVSKDVWKGIVSFLYSGKVHTELLLGKPPSLGRLIELLRACTLYSLPEPLLELAQASICPMLAEASPPAVLQVFSLAAGAVPMEKADVASSDLLNAAARRHTLLGPTRETAAYWVLARANEATAELVAGVACGVLTRALEIAEDAFRRVMPAGGEDMVTGPPSVSSDAENATQASGDSLPQ